MYYLIGEKMPKVSIIMPVYNSERYLSATIDSVLNQTYKDFELILVDDGSSDSSGSICDNYAEKDCRIVVVHKTNGGICNARNAGLRVAKGEYIGFCDNDDYMMPQSLEKAVMAADSTNADIVRFNRRRLFITDKKTLIREKKLSVGYTVEINKWDSFLRVIEDCGYGVWAGIIKANFLYNNNLQFNEKIKFGCEDHLFTVEACGKAHTITVIPDVLYEWRTRLTSSTSQKSGESIFRNRVEGIFSWKKLEDEIGLKLHREEMETKKRLSVYVICIMKEINRLNLPYKERKYVFRSVKQELLDGNNLCLRDSGSLKNFVKIICAKYNMLFTFKSLQYFIGMVSKDYDLN